MEFGKRLNFKANGHQLKIRQTSKDKNKEVHRNSRKSMYDFSEWMCGCEETNSFYFPESVQLCAMPMTTVESERCFSTLNRIKIFLRNTMGQERLSALAMLSIEKTFTRSIPNFNERVIDHFAGTNERRIHLKFKHI